MKSYFLLSALTIMTILNSFGQPSEFWTIYNNYRKASKESNFKESKDVLHFLISNPEITPASHYPYLHNSIGLVYWNLGVMDSATYHYQIAEQLSLETEIIDFNLLNSIYSNLAILHKQKKQYNHSLEYYNKAESVLNNLNVKDTLFYKKLSIIKLNIGIAYYELSNYAESLNELLNASTLKLKYNFPYLGSVNFNLARVYWKLNEHSLAVKYFEESLSQWIMEYDSTYYQLGSIYFNYAHYEIEQGNRQKGLDLYKNALAIFLQNYGTKHPYTSDCYEYMAKYYLENKDYHTALHYAQQSLISSCSSFNDTCVLANPVGHDSFLDIHLIEVYQIKIKALKGLSNSKKQNQIGNQLFTKEEILKYALEIVEHQIVLIRKVHLFYFDQETRLSLNEDFKQVFLDGMEISSMLYETSMELSYLNLSFSFASLGKSIEFQYELIQRQKIFNKTDNAKVYDLKIVASNYANFIQLEQEKLARDSLLIASWRDSLFHINRKLDRNIAQILEKRNLTDLFNIDMKSLEIKDIQKKLHKKQTLIDFTISSESKNRNKIHAFIINQSSCYYRTIILDSTYIASIMSIHDHLNSLNLLNYNESKTNALYHSLHSLYKEIFQPIAPVVQGNELIIIPDDVFYFVPFDALIKDFKKQTLNPKFLIKDFSVSYLTNSKLLINKKTNQIFLPKVNAFTEFQNDDSLKSIQLPGAIKEVDNILKMYRGEIKSTIKSYGNLEKSLGEKRIMHFAMHSYAQGASNENAYLLLENTKNSTISNKLYDYEISQIRSSSPMVTLSSCESGLGKYYSGEGMMSLSRSFLISGAESVINTYWPINDKSSSMIITEYYRNLKRGRSKSKAMQHSKMTYLKNASPTLQHPYYWAGYRIWGNPQRIVIPKEPWLIGGISFMIIILIIYRRYKKYGVI